MQRLQPSLSLVPAYSFPTDQAVLSPDDVGSRSLKDILDEGFMWMPAPKNRRTIARRQMRRMGESKILKYATPKKNLVSCLECGHWHEAHFICGKLLRLLLS